MCFAGAEKMKGSRDVSGFLEVEKSRKSAGGGYEMRPGTRVACRVAVAALFLALLVTATTFAAQAFQPRVRPCLRCPFDWIGYRGKCYSFSEAEANWTSSRDNCSALGASLAMFDSTEDLSFMTRYKGISEHWIGLSREDEQQPWQWINSSRLHPLFGVRGGGRCAYLDDDDGLSSSRCGAERNWVCNKPQLPGPRARNATRASRNLCVDS
ncbi:C-type lectin domain family 2 member B-like isoform X2 [Struthio camelus]|uniref:C-type lectin domain family 2 member B-like isoform X2 n=1 Tax=Struthio camelus TaxID=8801 RepID=UPI003603EBAA